MTRTIIMLVSLLLGSLALPMALQEAALTHIRSSTLSAVRFAAAHDPAALAHLPVTTWREENGVQAAQLYRRGWEQFEMHIPRDATTIVADVNLQPLAAALLLGWGGWLRVLACMGMSGLLIYWMQQKDRPSRHPRVQRPVADHSSLPQITSSGAVVLIRAGLQKISHPALVLDRHHQLCAWNEALASQLPEVKWGMGLHVLDFAIQLPWGAQLMEAVDAARFDNHILIINEGDPLCVVSH